MYDSYIVRRTQIYLAEEQDDRLTRRAAGAGVTKSMLIRQAVDAFLDTPADSGARVTRFRSALEEVGRHPIALPDGADYVERMRSVDVKRQEELERPR